MAAVVTVVAAIAAEVPGEEPDRVAELRPRDAQVPAGISVAIPGRSR